MCDSLDAARATVAGRFEVLRVDATWEAALPARFGGDPASAKRAASLAAAMAGDDDASGERADGKRRLPLLGRALEPRRPPPELARHGGAQTLAIVAPELATARAAAAPFDGVPEIALELVSYDGLAAALVDGALDGRRLVRAVATDVASAAALLAIAGDFEVVVPLRQDTAPWLLAQAAPSPRLVVRQPNYDRVSANHRHDVDLRAFCAALPVTVPVENVPACILGRAPRREPVTADAAMLRPDEPPRDLPPSPAASSPTTSTPRRCAAAAAARPPPAAASTSTPSAPTASRR